MKSIVQLTRIAALAVVTFAAVLQVHAQSGTLTNTTESIWSDPTNWLNSVIASGAGNTATFSNETVAGVVVNLDSARTVGHLTYGSPDLSGIAHGNGRFVAVRPKSPDPR